VCLFLDCGFELYEGLWWGKFSLINHPRPKGRGIRREVGVDLIAASCGEYDPKRFKNDSLFGGQYSMPENTISFIQKFTEMRPLHDPPDPRPARPGLHLACQPAIDSASIILRKADGPGPVR
jgi:hypothetical protein